MSWQDYIDNSLIKTNHVDKGAIYGLSGESKWAATPGFDISPAEIKEVINCLTGSNPDKYFADGLYFGGERYVVTKVEGRSIHTNKGKAGIIVFQKLADYLVEKGY